LTQERWHVLAPLTGVVFVALAVLAFIISGETPDSNDPPIKILAFYIKHDTRQIWASVVLAWGAVFFLFFLGVLRTTLRAAEGGLARLSTVAFGGGVVLAIGMLAFAGFTFCLADIADDGLTPQAAQALNALNTDFFFPVAVGLGTLLISTALFTIRSRALPQWLAWSALVIGIAAVTPIGFFAFLAFGLWTLAASIVIWQASTAAPPPAAPGTIPG
jgi:hypothetical protein